MALPAKPPKIAPKRPPAATPIGPPTMPRAAPVLAPLKAPPAPATPPPTLPSVPSEVSAVLHGTTWKDLHLGQWVITILLNAKSLVPHKGTRLSDYWFNELF